ncbi:MAG: fasciclin domain-containing protein [Anaerolineae bacterium]|nr:fasciclin domain-containing protein [Anaerolineae bacterium]
MWKSVLLVVVVLLFGASLATAAGHETVVDVAVSDDRFDTLVAAVVAAGLDDELSGGSWTVFAPTDAAFAKLGLNAGNIATELSEAELVNILLYHVLSTPVSSAEAKASVGDIVMANGQKAGLKFFDGSLYVNDDAKVIIPDIVAANGVIHVVDTVILGPWPRSESAATSPAMPAAPAGNTIVDIAVNDGRFDTLVAAVVAAGLDDALSSGSWTVFAPTDAAFAKLGLDASNIASAFTTAELTDILLYHVLTTPVSSADAKASVGDIVMGNGEKAGLKFFEGNLYVNDDAKVIIADVMADNGVIHAVDTVILGPWPR